MTDPAFDPLTGQRITPIVPPAALRTDGPTLEEYIAAGYKAENYPPAGFAVNTSKRTPPPLAPATAKSGPVLDRKQAFGTIMHGNSGQDALDMPMFHQNGNYFRANGSFHSNDGMVKKKVVAPVKAVDTLPAVTDDEMAELLMQPEAEELLAMPRDKIIALVNAGNGPVISGEGSTQRMVAWILKNTAAKDRL